jgi:DNA polymerase III alpha subunit (gram-positive type)
MTRRICYLYTETNGLHELDENVSKKNLFGFARLVALNYEIGYIESNNYTVIKSVRKIIKPRCMFISDASIKIHGITNESAKAEGSEIESVLNDFLADLKSNNVTVIVSHNITFHLRTLQAEYIRYNLSFNFLNYIIIDTISFYHQLYFPKLKDLYEQLYNKKPKTKTNLELMKLCFNKLYDDYEKSII